MAGNSQRQAAIDAGVAPGGADSFAQRTLKSERFLDAFHRMLARQGLTDDNIAHTHREQLEANRTIYATKDGKITDTLEVPDHNTRMKAVKVGWELYRRIGSNQLEEKEEAAPPPIIVISPQRKLLLERLIGGPLDCRVIDDDANFAERQADGEATPQTVPQKSYGPESPDAIAGALPPGEI